MLVLVAIGVAAAAGRSAYIGDFARRGNPLRRRILDALDREDPYTVQRVIELERLWIRHTRPQPRLDVALSPPRPAPP